MPCEEIRNLESIWEKRFASANSVTAGGLFAVPQALTLRQLRAKQAQAALAILVHQKQCPRCNSDEHLEAFVA